MRFFCRLDKISELKNAHWYMKTQWDLSSLYPEFVAQHIVDDLIKLHQNSKNYTMSITGKIATFDTNNWLAHFAAEEKIEAEIARIGIYLNLLTAKESQNQEYLQLSQKFSIEMVSISALFLPLKDEILALGYDALITLSHTPKLAAYKNYFVQTAQGIQHYLGEKTEHALSQKSLSGASAFVDLHEQLTADFSYKVVVDKQPKILTESEVRALRLSPDRAKREAATRALAEKYGQKEHQVVFAKAYSAVVQNWVADISLRGYEGVMAPRNESEELETQTVDNLLDAVREHYPLYHRFLKAKATLLGLEKLEVWDIFAPIDTVADEVSFEQAQVWYFECAGEFDSEWEAISRKIFDAGQVDVFPKTGKTGGAFANYAKNTQSWVMLNHIPNLDSAFTLAHELGHAIHGELSQVQPAAVYSSPLALAETASIFNETLFGKYLEPRLTSAQKLQYLLTELDDFFSTIFRQIMYVSFEKQVHESFLAGAPLSFEEYNTLWAQHTEALYGEAVEKNKELYQMNWSAIPHIFHTPFYCYTYAFGNLLSLELYQKYTKEGAAFIPVFKQILAAGGSKPPRELLAEHGIDISTKQFFERGLSVISEMVQKLEAQVPIKI